MSRINKRIADAKERLKGKDLNYLLEEISVMPVDDLDNHADNPFLQGWYAVTDDQGIVAYFGEEMDAFTYRLDYINSILNR